MVVQRACDPEVLVNSDLPVWDIQKSGNVWHILYMISLKCDVTTEALIRGIVEFGLLGLQNKAADPSFDESTNVAPKVEEDTPRIRPDYLSEVSMSTEQMDRLVQISAPMGIPWFELLHRLMKDTLQRLLPAESSVETIPREELRFLLSPILPG